MVPNYKKVIDFDLKSFIHSCANYNVDENKFYNYFEEKSKENIKEVFKYSKFNENFNENLTNYVDDTHCIGFITPSYDEFIKKILLQLNANSIEEVKERITLLSHIIKEDELAVQFPYLFRDLQDGRKYMRTIEKREKEENIELKEEKHYFYSCAMRRGLDNYIEKQAELYNRFYNNRNEYKELVESKYYNNLIRSNCDLEKIALFFGHNYVKKIQDTHNLLEQKRYLELMKKLILSGYVSNKKIYLDETIINIDYIEEQYQILKWNNENDSRKVTWIILPEGKKDISKEDITNTHSKIVLSEEELNILREKGKEKTDFYNNSNYLIKVVGRLNTNGYIAYIYKNGKVLLDTEYNIDNPESAVGNALYCMEAKNFLKLSKLDKTTLRKNPEVKRIIHSKNWLEKASNVINIEPNENTEEEVKQLVKTIKKER